MGNWYELYIACPICYNGGMCRRNERTYWKHTNCSGWIEISDQLDLRCDKHGNYTSLSRLELYRCLNIICDNPKIPKAVIPNMINRLNTL